jgi:hypothetical protein
MMIKIQILIVKKPSHNGVAFFILSEQNIEQKNLNNGSIAAIQTMTTPDALITGIANGKEYP